MCQRAPQNQIRIAPKLTPQQIPKDSSEADLQPCRSPGNVLNTYFLSCYCLSAPWLRKVYSGGLSIHSSYHSTDRTRDTSFCKFWGSKSPDVGDEWGRSSLRCYNVVESVYPTRSRAARHRVVQWGMGQYRILIFAIQ